MNIHARAEEADSLPTMDILGTPVAALRWDEGIARLTSCIARGVFTRVGFLNAHNANIAQVDRRFALALRDFLILPDGIGVDIAAKILYGHAFPDNLNGTDFIPAFLAATEQPLRIALLGARRENAEAACRALKAIAPRHTVTVVHDGFFSSDEEPEVLRRIAELRPDVLLVAMGVPRQELWIAEHLTPSHCTLPIAVGALLDFLSGAVPRAPMWMRRMRLEWVFRLMLEPGRLWRRYVVGNPLFLARVIGQKLGQARPTP